MAAGPQQDCAMKHAEFLCPYCAQPNLLTADPSDGKSQVFTIDCEVCCRPIRITVYIDDESEPVIQADAELND